jgi:CheY-like chemotaxis protein
MNAESRVVARPWGGVEAGHFGEAGATRSSLWELSADEFTYSEPGEPWREESASPPAVLVVDDETVVRQVVQRMLAPPKWVVAEAIDGIDALEYLQRNRQPAPGIILTDLEMPRLSGHVLIETLGLLRPALPVIAMTGFSQERRHPFPWGCLAKPFDEDELQLRLQRVLDESRRKAAETAVLGTDAERVAPADDAHRAALARARELFEESGDLVVAARTLQEDRLRRALRR